MNENLFFSPWRVRDALGIEAQRGQTKNKNKMFIGSPFAIYGKYCEPMDHTLFEMSKYMFTLFVNGVF